MDDAGQFKNLIKGIGNQLNKGVNVVRQIAFMNKLGLSQAEKKYGFKMIYNNNNENNQREEYNFYHKNLSEVNKWVAYLNLAKERYQYELDKKVQKQKENDNAEEEKMDSEEEEIELQQKFTNQVIREGVAHLRDKKGLFAAIRSKKFLQLRRQILYIFNTKQKLINDCSYISLKDITGIQSSGHGVFQIFTTLNKTMEFECKVQSEVQQWITLINKLKENEDANLEELVPQEAHPEKAEISEINESQAASNSYYQKFFAL